MPGLFGRFFAGKMNISIHHVQTADTVKQALTLSFAEALSHDCIADCPGIGSL